VKTENISSQIIRYLETLYIKDMLCVNPIYEGTGNRF